MLSHIRNKRQAPPRKGGPGPKAQGPKGAQVKKVGKGPNGAGPGGARKVAGPAKGKTCNLFKLKAKTLTKQK